MIGALSMENGVLAGLLALTPLVAVMLAVASWMALMARARRWSWRVSAVLSWLGVLCLLAFTMIGARVDENNILREPFNLVPLGIFLISLGTLGSVGCGTIGLVRHRSGKAS